MSDAISSARFEAAQHYESIYWSSRQHDPVGFLHDLEGNFAIAQHLQMQGYLKTSFRRLLDVGCGGLGVGILWLLRAHESYGLDPLPVLRPRTDCDLLDAFVSGVQARTQYRTEKAECLPFENGFFDCVVCNNVLDHVQNPSAILAEIRRVLAPDGVFAFAVDTHSIRTLFEKRVLRCFAPNSGSLPGHPHEWTERQMHAMLKQHGFAVESHRPRAVKGRLVGRVRRTTWLLRHGTCRT